MSDKTEQQQIFGTDDEFRTIPVGLEVVLHARFIPPNTTSHIQLLDHAWMLELSQTSKPSLDILRWIITELESGTKYPVPVLFTIQTMVAQRTLRTSARAYSLIGIR